MTQRNLTVRDRLSLVRSTANKIQVVTYMLAITFMTAMVANHHLQNAVFSLFAPFFHAINH